MENIVDRWIEELKGGKRIQATGTLHTETGFCCLGVLCDISEVSNWVVDPGSRISLYEDSSVSLPVKVMDVAGLSDCNGGFYLTDEWLDGLSVRHRQTLRSFIVNQMLPEGSTDITPKHRLRRYNSLSRMNDEGCSFKVIAAMIESRPYGLFRE